MYQKPESSHGASGTMNCMEVCGGSGSTEMSYARPGLDVWVWSNSHGGVEIDGGDIHFLSSCASGRVTRMLLADICGHGSAFGDLAVELRDLMICHVNSIKQARFIRQMHRRFLASSDRGGFATALLSTYFAPTKSFTLCNAGHPTPLVYRAAVGAWSVLEQPKSAPSAINDTPLGVINQDEYQQFSTRLENNDMVLSYSNLLTECRDRDGRTLGIDGLLRQVEHTDPARASDILPSLINRLRPWNVDPLATGDATLLLCRATDRGAGWKNSFLAPLRMLRAVEDNTRLG